VSKSLLFYFHVYPTPHILSPFCLAIAHKGGGQEDIAVGGVTVAGIVAGGNTNAYVATAGVAVLELWLLEVMLMVLLVVEVNVLEMPFCCVSKAHTTFFCINV